VFGVTVPDLNPFRWQIVRGLISRIVFVELIMENTPKSHVHMVVVGLACLGAYVGF